MYPNQKSISLFPSPNRKTSTKPKTADELTKEVVLSSPRNGIPQSPQSPGQKNKADKLKMVRDAIGNLFSGSGLFTEWKDSVKANLLMNDDIASEKFGTYNDEFARLHKAVQDAFRLSGRPDLADSFGTTVPQFNQGLHPIDFIATLLKGASNPLSKAAAGNVYAILEPFKTMMQDALTSKGVAAPSDMDTLTQIFYNTFVAKPGSENEVMNFDTMNPGTMYHVDEAVVNSVVTFVKTLADKKTNGEQLSSIQDKIANIGLKVQSGLTQAATDEVNKKVGEKVTTNSKTILIIAVIAIAIIGYALLKK